MEFQREHTDEFLDYKNIYMKFGVHPYDRNAVRHLIVLEKIGHYLKSVLVGVMLAT